MSERSVAMAETPTAYKFTVEAYDRMVEAGILTEEDPAELLRGEVVVMAPIGSRHSACVDRILEAFDPVGKQVIRRIQSPARLADSEPEPDVQLLVRRDEYYADAHPEPKDIHLIVEVAESSQVVDREVKAPLYAENGIRDYWLVDLATDRIEVYRDPEKDRYRTLRIFGRGDSLAPLAFPDLAFCVEDLLP